jgi:hypothetical protein
MVFGLEPCSRSRSKRRNVSSLGLLPPQWAAPPKSVRRQLILKTAFAR